MIRYLTHDEATSKTLENINFEAGKRVLSLHIDYSNCISNTTCDHPSTTKNTIWAQNPVLSAEKRCVWPSKKQMKLSKIQENF